MWFELNLLTLNLINYEKVPLFRAITMRAPKLH